MDAVKAYIEGDWGMSLKAANGKYLSRIHRQLRNAVDAQKEVKDPYTRFEASEKDGKLVLKADNGKYLSRIQRDFQFVEAEKAEVDMFCQFRVISVGKGVIALQADNGLFVSIMKRGEFSSIEVTKEGIDDDCKFTIDVGDLIPPTFEILSVKLHEDKATMNHHPAVVTTETVNNKGSTPVQQAFTLTWQESNTQTTTWKHAWGVQFSYTYKSGTLTSAIAQHEFSIHLSYNGEYGTSSTEEVTSKFERKINVTAAARKKTVAKLLVKKADDALIPFTATIKRTKADGTETTFEEEGTWQGTAYHSATIEIEELPLDK